MDFHMSAKTLADRVVEAAEAGGVLRFTKPSLDRKLTTRSMCSLPRFGEIAAKRR